MTAEQRKLALFLLGAVGLVAGIAVAEWAGLMAPPGYRGALDVGAGRASVHVQTITPSVGGVLVVAQVPRKKKLRLRATLLSAPRTLGSLAKTAKAAGALVAINGDYHQLDGPDRYLPSGVFVADGAAVVTTGSRCSFWIGADGRPQLGTLDLETQPELALGSGPRLLTAGALTEGLAEVELPGYTRALARAAIGISEDSIYLVTTMQTPRAGLAHRDMAAALLELGCTDALALDGGPSATLWVRTGWQGGVIANIPPGLGAAEPDLASGLLVLPPSGGGVPLE